MDEALQDNESLRSEVDFLRTTINDTQTRIKGKAMLDPAELRQFPTEYRRIMSQLYQGVYNDTEAHYIMTQLDPFHPHAAGARVPRLIPQSTVTYHTYNETTIASAEKTFYLTNFELISNVRAVLLTGDLVCNNLLTNLPVSLHADGYYTSSGDLHEFGRNVKGIHLGQS